MSDDLFEELPHHRSGLNIPTSALTIGAHPDDAEFGAGATLAGWAATGCTITMLIVTDGSKGSWDPDADQAALADRRVVEQAKAAEVLGASSVVHLGEVDGELEYSQDLKRAIAEQIRMVRPDVILTHDPWQRYQLHPDHRATGLLAIDAVVAAREPLMYKDLGLEAHRPESVLLWSADEPDHHEPVTAETFEKKVNALLCHSSQSTTTMGDAVSGAEERLRFVDRLAAWQAEMGERFDVGPAEVFKRLTP